MKRKLLLLSAVVVVGALGAKAQCAPDVTIPTAVCQDVTVYLDGTGNVTVPATSVDNGSSDNCLLASVHFAKPLQLIITATQGDQIFTANLDGSNLQVLYPSMGTGGAGPVGVRYEPTNDQIYIPLGNTHEIATADAFGGGIIGNLGSASGPCCEHLDVALDAANNRLFYSTGGGGGEVYVANMDGTGSPTLVYSGSGIVGVAYDAVNDKVYCVDIYNEEIVSVNPDGTGAAVLYDNADGVAGPRQIEVDPANNRIWWTNRDTDEIMSGSLDGVAAATVTWGSQSGLYGIHYDDVTDQLLWVTFGANDEVHTGAADGTGVANTIISGSYGSFRDVTIAGSTVPTLSLNFDCSDLGANTVDLVALDASGNSDTCQATITVLDTISPTAMCQDATVYLDANGDASVQPDLVYYSSVNTNDIWSADFAGGNQTQVISGAGTDAIGIDYNMGNLYWATGQGYNVSTAPAGGGANTVIPNSTTGNFNPMHEVVVDQPNNRYFYTESYSGVYVATLDGLGGQTQLAFANNAITGVDYDPIGDKLYYVDQADEVYSMNSNGTAQTLLYDNSDGVSNPRQIVIDAPNNRLWITSQGSGEIQMGSLDGVATLTPVYSGEGGCYGIDYEAVGDILFWTQTGGNLRTAAADGTGTPVTIVSGIGGLRGVRAVKQAGTAVTDNGSSDNCSDLTITTVPTTFNCADAGNTISVTTTVMDGSGNSSFCVSNVTVMDTLGPNIACLADINTTANAANCEAMVTWTDPTAVDNCGGAVTWTSSHNSGDTFPLGTTTVTYTAMDASGNTSDCMFDVIVTSDLAVAATQVDVLCFGDTTGSVDITVTGGTAPYTYDWDIDGTGDFDDSEDLGNLGAGAYAGTVMDVNGCTDGGTLTINEPATAVDAVLTTQTDVTCGGTDGAIDVTVSGGTPGYTFDWDNDGTGDFDDTEDLTALGAGPFELVVQDANGCTDTLNVTLVSIGGATLTETHVDPSCPGGTDGSIDMTITGGTAPFTHDWDNDGTGDNDDTEDLTGLTAGTYNVIVTDASACVSVLAVTIPDPAGMTLTFTSTDEITGNDGTIDLTVAGGTGPYTYDWDNDGTGDNDDTEDLTGLTSGTYDVIVTDANGCTATITAAVGSQLSVGETAISYSIFPNPTSGDVTVQFSTIPVNATLQIVGLDGKVLRSVVVQSDVMTLDLSGMAKGVYLVELQGEDYKIPTRIVLQ